MTRNFNGNISISKKQIYSKIKRIKMLRKNIFMHQEIAINESQTCLCEIEPDLITFIKYLTVVNSLLAYLTIFNAKRLAFESLNVTKAQLERKFSNLLKWFRTRREKRRGHDCTSLSKLNLRKAQPPEDNIKKHERRKIHKKT